MKNITNCIGVLLCFFLILTGCQGEVKDGLGEHKERDFTISWTNYIIKPVPENAENLLKYEELFNVDIDFWNLEHSRYDELLGIKLASGQVPDLMMIRDPNTLPQYVSQGVLSPIPMEKVKTHAPNYHQIMEEEAKEYWQYGMMGHKLYGIPSVNYTNKFRVPLVYRKDWMEAVGVTKLPETLEEFEELMYLFAEADPDGNGIKDTYGLSRDGIDAVFGAFGGMPQYDYWIVQDGEIYNSVTMPEMKEAIRLLKKWYRAGVLDPEFITGENYGGYWATSHAFINGRIGMTSRGNFYHWTDEGDYNLEDDQGKAVPVPGSDIMKEFHMTQPKGSIAFGPTPIGPEGHRGTRQYNQLMRFYGIGNEVSKEEGKMERILEILDYASASPEPEVRIGQIYGQRGLHWDWVNKEKGYYKVLPPFSEERGFNYKLGYNALTMTVPLPMGAKERWAASLELDQQGIESAIQVATPYMSKYKDKLSKLREEAYIQMITGEKPIDYFETFVDAYMRLGGRQIRTEVKVWHKEYHNKGE